LRPPKGVDPDAFGQLLNRWDSGVFETVLAINAAENNTSIVFVLEWRGWSLLFTGDAEKASWRVMEKRGVLKPIHFLKVSHHGSATGAPSELQLEVVLPESPPDSRSRYALVSTRSRSKAYPYIPDQHSLSRLRKRCKKVFSTEDKRPGSAVSVSFAG
jgi:beta-lactamase superfamily II metal-dependent hydrolase